MASVDYEEGILEGILVVRYDGTYGYNPECVVAVGYGSKVKGTLNKVSTTTKPLNLPSILMVVKKTSTKATTPTTMCFTTIKLVVIS